MSSPGLSICKFIPDAKIHEDPEKRWKSVQCQLYGLSSLKKTIGKYKHDIVVEEMLSPGDQMERFEYLSSWIINKCKEHKVTDVFLEGYAYGARGQVFHIGENTGILKYRLMLAGINVTIIQPSAVKKVATGKGNANKELMQECFVEETGIDIKDLLGLTEKQWSPSGDLIDAYYIAKAGFKDANFQNIHTKA